MNDDVVPDETAVMAEVDCRNRQRNKITFRDVATFTDGVLRINSFGDYLHMSLFLNGKLLF